MLGGDSLAGGASAAGLRAGTAVEAVPVAGREAGAHDAALDTLTALCAVAIALMHRLRGAEPEAEVQEVLARAHHAAYRACRELGRFEEALRHGGEEFVLVMPGMALDSAADVCERLRDRLASHHWGAAEVGRLAITVSIGLAAAPSYDVGHLLHRADRAL